MEIGMRFICWRLQTHDNSSSYLTLARHGSNVVAETLLFRLVDAGVHDFFSRLDHWGPKTKK